MNYLNIISRDNGQLKEYHLGDILISTPSTPTPSQISKARQKAESVYKEIETRG